LPPAVLVGLSERDDRTGGTTVRAREALTPPYDAVIVAVLVDATGLVVTEKIACELPAATVTVAGTEATAELLLASATDAPPVGAAAVSVTVPLTEVPPVTELALRVSDERAVAPSADRATTRARSSPSKNPMPRRMVPS
jgi:hypothetical protein